MAYVALRCAHVAGRGSRVRPACCTRHLPPPRWDGGGRAPEDVKRGRPVAFQTCLHSWRGLHPTAMCKCKAFLVQGRGVKRGKPAPPPPRFLCRSRVRSLEGLRIIGSIAAQALRAGKPRRRAWVVLRAWQACCELMAPEHSSSAAGIPRAASLLPTCRRPAPPPVVPPLGTHLLCGRLHSAVARPHSATHRWFLCIAPSAPLQTQRWSCSTPACGSASWRRSGWTPPNSGRSTDRPATPPCGTARAVQPLARGATLQQ